MESNISLHSNVSNHTKTVMLRGSFPDSKQEASPDTMKGLCMYSQMQHGRILIFWSALDELTVLCNESLAKGTKSCQTLQSIDLNISWKCPQDFSKSCTCSHCTSSTCCQLQDLSQNETSYMLNWTSEPFTNRQQIHGLIAGHFVHMERNWVASSFSCWKNDLMIELMWFFDNESCTVNHFLLSSKHTLNTY